MAQEALSWPAEGPRVIPVTIDGKYIDNNGHLNYIGYKIIFEGQRNAFMEARGIGLEALASRGLHVSILHDSTDYGVGVTEDDVVDINTTLTHSSFDINFLQWMDRANRRVATHRLRIVLIEPPQTRPRRIPEYILGKLHLPEDQVPFIYSASQFLPLIPRDYRDIPS